VRHPKDEGPVLKRKTQKIIFSILAIVVIAAMILPLILIGR